MSDQSSELVEISKLNGDFRKNYGKLIGALLYLRSVSGGGWIESQNVTVTPHQPDFALLC